ncbi:MAG: hypothetical protein ABL912_06160 [Novosphingobium sp.]
MDTIKSLLRGLYIGMGGLMVFSGLFWALQGLGIIMWPPESFMLADRAWTLYGLIFAAFGAGLIWVLRGSRG